jgi:hypothetical protein
MNDVIGVLFGITCMLIVLPTYIRIIVQEELKKQSEREKDRV